MSKYLQYFKQAWNIIRQEKLFSSIYIVGTGLSITVVMVLSIAAGTKKMFGVSNDLRTKVVLMIFFLLNILLCVPGTLLHE
jgi:hypothetical protein